MQIDLSKKEFRRLLDMVYIGNWILNSTAATTLCGLRRFGVQLFALCREQGMGCSSNGMRGLTYFPRLFRRRHP